VKEQRKTWSRGQQKTTVKKKRLRVGKISLPITFIFCKLNIAGVNFGVFWYIVKTI